MGESTICVFIVSIFLKLVLNEEIGHPSSVIAPRNYNYHAYELFRHSNDLEYPEPTKQGPVLFPNDAPPPPRPPLIVTSRPLLEQVARSELNQIPDLNNSIAEQSQINRVQTKPNYLARIKQYAPYNYVSSTPRSVILVDSVTGKQLYDGNFQNYPAANAGYNTGHQYNDYEEQTVLPPIYKALSDHANEKVFKINQKKNQPVTYQKYQLKDTDYNNYHSNDVQSSEGSKDEYTQGKKYAFSYSVKDHNTGDDFSHSQRSSGQATNGEYRVRLPDGRMQIVSYVADENGYKADVRYDDDHEVKVKGNTIEQPKNNENYKALTPIRDDYYNQYSDLSKEYYNDDYSLDYPNKNYKDYSYNQRKFAAYDPKSNADKIGVIVVPNQFKSSTVKPSYEELKPLFVSKKLLQEQLTPNYLLNRIPIEHTVPSTTTNSLVFDQPSTERVVVIGTKPSLYTNIRSSIPPLPFTSTSSPLYHPVAPNFLIASTVSPILPKNVHLSNNKAVLSTSFIDRINKYLNFK